MEDDHGVVALWGECAPCFVGYWEVLEDDARFEFEVGYDGDSLVGDEGGEGVLGLFFWGYSSCDQVRVTSKILQSIHQRYLKPLPLAWRTVPLTSAISIFL